MIPPTARIGRAGYDCSYAAAILTLMLAFWLDDGRRGSQGSEMLLAVVFVASLAVAIFFLIRSQLALPYRIGLSVALIVFALIAYLLASRSSLSPFSSSQSLSFGFWDQAAPIATAVVGAVAGVLGSYFFHLGQKQFLWRDFIRPLTTSPIVLIPTVKLVEAAGEQTLMTLLVLFALSYQNGFFWERLLKSGGK